MQTILKNINNAINSPGLILFILMVIVNIPIYPGKTKAQSDSLEILISSRNTSSVKRYNGISGKYIDDFIPSGSNGLKATQEVVLDKDGNILVTGRGNKGIMKYNGNTGEFMGIFSKGYELDNPTKMTIGPDNNIYISQWGNVKKKVVRFDVLNGNFIDEFTKTDLNEGSGHTWDSDGNLYVACYGSKDVRKFDKDGNFTGIFTEAGKLEGPVNLWFGTDKNLYILDWELGKVLVFDGTNGKYISTFISGLKNAEGFVMDADSNYYVCDWTDNNIKKFDKNGSYLGVFIKDGNLKAPNSIIFRKKKHLH